MGQRLIPLVVIAVVVSGTTRLDAVDFLRGDGNGDGVISLADAYAISAFFYNGVFDSSLQVIPDITSFIRGDSNGDEKVDISDARTTLNYLFLGKRAPYCFDAADANDDGRLDISDPGSTLRFLFLGGEDLPAPHPDIGEDPTEDTMTCFVRGL